VVSSSSLLGAVQVFKTWPQRPLTTHQHPNIVSPLATFRAAHLSTGTCTDYDNVAVLSCTRVVNFHEYWRDQHGGLSSALVEQAACLTLARVLSAAIYLHEHDTMKPRLMPRRVVMTVLDTGECYPLLRPSTRVSDNSGTVADDVAELVFVMLQLDKSDCTNNMQRRKSDGSARREKPAVIDVVAAFPAQSSYSRCLQRVVRYLRQTAVGDLWDDGSKRSLNLLEFTLWGPSEDDARMIAISDGRDTALQVWLSVTRCHLLAESALVEGPSQNGLEFAERAAFLCSATENSFLEITKLLFA